MAADASCILKIAKFYWLTRSSELIHKDICYILPICPEVLHGRISTTFCTTVEVADGMTLAKVVGDQSRDVDFV